jgi:hypothetical protein
VNIEARADGANEGHLNLIAGQNTRIDINGAGSTVEIITGDGESSNTWEFDSNSGLTFPDATTQTTAWAGGRVVAVPGASTGAAGDKAGDLAFDSQYIYYCTADYTDGIENIWKRVAWSNDTWGG